MSLFVIYGPVPAHIMFMDEDFYHNRFFILFYFVVNVITGTSLFKGEVKQTSKKSNHRVLGMI